MIRLASGDRSVELDGAELNVTVSALRRYLSHLEHEVGSHGFDAVVQVECDPGTVRMLLDRIEGRQRHEVEIRPIMGRRSYDRPGGVVAYVARCSCGAASERLSAAGMAHAWNDRHLAEEGVR